MPPLRRSALHHRVLAAGAQMAADGGWERVDSFGDPPAEAEALQTGLAVADVSDRFLLLVYGQDLPGWLPVAPRPGRVAPVNGGRPHDWCCRLTEDSALFLTAERLELVPPPGVCAHQVDLTCGRTALRVSGSRSASLLSAITQLDLRERAFPDGQCAQTSVARAHATLLRRDAGRLPGYEILVARDLGEYVWGAVLDAGSALGVRVVGAAALRGD